jgi:ADP-heptose:LPS heptosyltransferase
LRILAVRQDNNGDVLLAGPALRALAAGCTRLTLLCGPSGRAAAEAIECVDDVICCEAGWIEANPHPVEAANVASFVADIRKREFDEAIVFTSFHQSPLPIALLLRLAGVRTIAAISDDYAGSLLDIRHRVPDDVHEVERALSLAGAAGYSLPAGDDGRLAMRIAATNPFGDVGGYVVVHPGSTVPARAWHPDLNRQLVELLNAAGHRVVVTGTANETELCGFVAGDSAVNLAGKTTLAELARVIADARAIVVGNTGAAHVAAAVGTPVVSLFAPTIPAVRFRPWMVEHVLLGDQEICCRGCRARTCPRDDHACIDNVSVDDVLSALQHLHSSVSVENNVHIDHRVGAAR